MGLRTNDTATPPILAARLTALLSNVLYVFSRTFAAVSPPGSVLILFNALSAKPGLGGPFSLIFAPC
nr:hypothetical protein [Rickettsia fournieri]